MSIRGLFRRPVTFAAACALALSATLVAAAPAQAAPTATIAWSGSTLVVNATASPATIYLGFSQNTFAVPTVTLRLPGEGFASWPADCAEDNPVGLPDQYIHCAASAVNDLDVTYGAGNDTLYMDGACYNVITVNFGDGGNTMQGDSGCNTAINSSSGSGDDIIQMASGGGSATMGGGNDQFRGGVGNETALGGPGNDSLGGNSGNDVLRGEDGNDAIAGNYGNDVEDGGNGDDVIGNNDDDQGADDMIGGPGVDKVWFSDHSGGGMALSMDDVANDGTTGEGDNLHSDFEIVVGSPGADTITGTAAPDNLDGYWGGDTIRGGPGNDRIDGNSDDDALFGGDGDDTIYGGAGNDQVTGDGGVDNLFGDYTSCCLSNGNDKIFSADGFADAINCGGGADTLSADQLDVIGGDGNQLCEAVTRTQTVVTPPPGTPPPGTPPPPPPGPTTLTVKASTVGVPTRRKGVVVATVCSAKCSAAAGVVISKKIAKKYGLRKMLLIGLGQGASANGGKFKITVKIKAKARRKLARAGTIPARVVFVAVDAAGKEQGGSVKIKLKP